MASEAAACPRCRAPAPAGARFCPQCGQALVAGAAAPSGSRPAERRQVAILFADLTGYTALSNTLDAEEVYRLMARYFELVDGLIGQCGGTIDKHIGDAVMGVFGAPVAYGNDTMRALRAAAGVHAAMDTLSEEFGRPLTAHVGVASGEVVAADTGSSVHRNYTVTGDAVNLAARLNELARARETVISDDVYRACTSAIEVDPVGTVTIRGFAREMPVWKLRSLRMDVAAEHPLLGRDAELARFDALLESVETSGRGMAWLVRADPGMGKTRLLQELAVHARRRGHPTHVAAVLDFGTAQGRDVIHTLFGSLLGIAPEASDVSRHQGLARALEAGAVAAEDEPFATDLLALPQPAPEVYEAMDNATRTEGRVRALTSAVAHAARAGLVALFVEDVHWSTPWVQTCVRALIERATGLPLLLVCTSRREGDPFGTPPLDVAVERCELPPLATRDALALARSFLTAHADVARGCVERAQGNPLFLTQLLRSGADGSAIPGTIQSVVLSRLDRLPAADKAAVQAAAVVGQRFDLALLRHLLDDPAYDAGTLLGRDLVRADDADARRFQFVHALIRDGAYASLLHSNRRGLHLRAAAWYADRDAVLRAEHLDRADDPGAAAAYLAAARSEAAALRVDAALRLARRGSELAAPAAIGYDLARFEGDLARDTGDLAASVAAFERALALAATDAQRCGAYLGFAAVHRATGASEEGLAVLDKVDALVGSTELAREAARASYLRGCLEFARWNARASQTAQERALAQARAAGDAEAEAQALSGLADVLYVDGRMQSSFAAFKQCVALCDRLGLARFSLNNRCMLAIVHSYLAPVDGQMNEAERAREEAHKLRHRAAEVMADETLGWVYAIQGRHAEAIPPSERSLALARAINSRRFVLFDLSILTHAYWHAGRKAEAEAALAEAIDVAEELGMQFIGGGMHGAHAMMARDRDELAAAIVKGDAELAAGAPAHSHFWYRRAAIDALLAWEEFDGALRQAAALEAFTREEPVPWADFQVARARALAQAGLGRPDPAALAACRAEAERLHLVDVVPMLEAALRRVG